MENKMRHDDPTTTDLAEFGYEERIELVKLLNAWNEQGLPNDFADDRVRAMFNKNSGCVFLTNEDYQTAMMNGNKLEIWHSCFNCRNEGFEEDCKLNDEGCNKCNDDEEEQGDE